MGLEHRVGSSSVALVAPWRTGQGEDAPWHPGEAFARMWGGHGDGGRFFSPKTGEGMWGSLL